jgi:hypothetical protein
MYWYNFNHVPVQLHGESPQVPVPVLTYAGILHGFTAMKLKKVCKSNVVILQPCLYVSMVPLSTLPNSKTMLCSCHSGFVLSCQQAPALIGNQLLLIQSYQTAKPCSPAATLKCCHASRHLPSLNIREVVTVLWALGRVDAAAPGVVPALVELLQARGCAMLHQVRN